VLSKLHRKAEALDGACLRAQGHPNDPAVRQELLDALDWDRALRPDHAHPMIQNLFKQVHDHSVSLSNVIRSAAHAPDGAVQMISHGIQRLREHIGALVKVLAARRAARHTGDPAP
jgi:hypothetical protein